MRLDGGQGQILGEPEGIEWLGGIDFDEVVIEHIDRALGGAVNALDSADPRDAPVLFRLRQECVLAKEALSADPEVTARVSLPGQAERGVHLSRDTFEERIGPAVSSSIDALLRAIDSAGLAPEALSAVLLVGGSSRIPLISRMLEDRLRRQIVVDSHPKHAVALGAAMIAARDPGTRDAEVPAPGGPGSERRRWPGRLLFGVGLILAIGAVLIGSKPWASPASDRAATPARAPQSPARSAQPSVTALLPTVSPGATVITPPPITLPPVNGRFDHQTGGAYPPGASAIIYRHHGDKPVSGRYTICNIDAFETESNESPAWLQAHDDLILKDDQGRRVPDPQTRDQYLFDTSTVAARQRLSAVANGLVDECAAKGFQAVASDDLDSWTRSGDRLTQADNVSLATALVSHAHAAGLAVAQLNVPMLKATGKQVIGFDFAIAEDCEAYDECDAYTEPYGRHVIEIEYTRHDRRVFDMACDRRGADLSIIRRDSDAVPRGEKGYVYEQC